MEKTKICKYCGASSVEYCHKLNPMLVSALTILFNESENQPVNINSLSLTMSQRCNFQKLKYWKFVEKGKTCEGHRRGVWQLTHKGGLFLNGTIGASIEVYTFRGRVVRYNGPEVKIYNITEGK